MDSQIPTVQILEKADYRKQHLVKLPEALPLPALGESQVRIRSSIISLSVNNFTYARLGDALGWWNVWSTPESLPDPYTDTSEYGRVSAWGFSTVVDSTVPSLPAGTELFGYIPIATLPEVLTLEESTEVAGHFIEKSHHRQHLFTLYNRYLKLPSPGLSGSSELEKALHSLMLVETSYNLNRHAHSWIPARPSIHPGPGIPNNPAWTPRNTDLKDAIVIILAASGKVALSFASHLKYDRPESHKTSKVIAIASEPSLEFLKSTNLHNEVLSYSSLQDSKFIDGLGLTPDSKISIFNFGARGDSATELAEALKPLTKNPLSLVAVASDPAPADPSVTASRLAKNAEQGWVRVNASGMRELTMKMLGEKAYFEELEKAWDAFKGNGAIPWLDVEWGEGMEGVGRGWESLVAGTAGPGKGLVFKL